MPLTTAVMGRQPEGTWGSGAQLLKLSFFPQWYHHVTLYIPSAGAEMPFMVREFPIPPSRCATFFPCEQHSIPAVICSGGGHLGPLHMPMLVLPAIVFGGIVSASYQARNLPFAGGAASPAVAPSTPLSASPPGAPATAAASGIDETLPPAPDPGIPTPPLPATGREAPVPAHPPAAVADGLRPPTRRLPATPAS